MDKSAASLYNTNGILSLILPTYSSIALQNLFTLKVNQQTTIGVAIVYCDYRDQANQSVRNILGSILQQLLLALPSLPKEVHEQLESIRKGMKQIVISDILQIFKLALPQFDGIFVCIDALDELETSTCIELLRLFRDELGAAKLFLTGRPTVRNIIIRTLRISTQARNEVIIEAHHTDIKAFLLKELLDSRDENPSAMNNELQEASCKGM